MESKQVNNTIVQDWMVICMLQIKEGVTDSKTPPKETFERALERVRSQIEMRNDIMRASLETALRLQEGRGSFVLYGF